MESAHPQQGINIADDADVGQAALLNLPNIVAIAFSPKNTYLTTFQRPQPGAGNAEKNLKVTFISHTQISERYLLRWPKKFSSAYCICSPIACFSSRSGYSGNLE